MTHSSTNKIIITNGCSFTNGNFGTGSKTWADNLKREFSSDKNIIFENIGWKGNSNDLIIPQTSDYINNLDNDSEIYVIMQLTALDRIVVDGKKSPTITSFLKSLNWMNWAMSQNESVSGFWRDYFINEYSEENHLNSLLSKLIDFQNDMKKYTNVKYKIFCGWDILTQKGDSNMWSLEEKYENKSDSLVVNLYESSQKLFNKLDLENFWFFSNEHIHYGGLSQWVQYNVDNKDWYRDINCNPIDYHPSDYAHSEFAKNVIVPMVHKMMENK